MDNSYNSITLSKKLLFRKTHTTSTLRSNRKRNPKQLTSKKMKPGEHVWLRKGKVYVSGKIKEAFCASLQSHPCMTEVNNAKGKMVTKPLEIHNYNKNMSGVDSCDQFTSYYSCPRKSVRWYTKVIFHLLDVTIVNSFLLFKEIKKLKMGLIKFRENIILDICGIGGCKDGRKLVDRPTTSVPKVKSKPVHEEQENIFQHILEKIPTPQTDKRKSYFLRC